MNAIEDKDIITSKKLKEEMDRERGDCLPEVNGDCNVLARRDKSFSNSIDFFIKLFKREKLRKKNL